jgi:signal transduction histidine kinase/class 3 adenylate cyclase/ligand-binding sensor domain-containing protein/ActR/RegA family two-component response regulator
MNKFLHGKGLFITCVIAILTLMSAPSSGQISTIRLSFHHLSPSEGLSEGTNAWVFRDSYGFVWISSLDGLNRFDGQSVKTYRFDPTDSTCIADNIVTSTFYEDINGDLWFTTYTGINVYRRQFDHFESFRLEDDLKNEITEDYFAFHLSKEGKLWVRTGLRDDGRFHEFDCRSEVGKIKRPLKGQRLAVITDQNGVETAIVSSLLSGSRGINITSLDNSNQFVSSTFFTDDISDGPSTTVYNILIVNNQELWLGSKIGLIRLNPVSGEFKIFDTAFKIPLGTVRSVVKNDNLLYISSNQEGLFVFDKDKEVFIEQFKPNPNNNLSLRSRRVSKLYIDSNHVLWVSYFEGGSDGVDFAHLKKNRLPILNLAGRTSYRAAAIVEDDNKNVHVAVGNSLYTYNAQRELINSISVAGLIRSFYKDNNGDIWIATRDADSRKSNLYKIANQSTLSNFVTSLDLQVRDICQLKDGRYLLATEANGVQEMEFNDGKLQLRSFNDMKEAEGAFISRVVVDQNGRVYVSINFDRLLIYSQIGNRLKLVATIPKTGECKSYYFFNDTSVAWIATSIGLISLNTETYDYRFVDESKSNIPNRKYFNLVSDQLGLLWLRSKQELLGYDFKSKKYSKFTAVDGLEEISGDFQPGIIDQNGFIWMAGKHGVNVFHPDSLLSVSVPTKPQITAILVNDSPHELPHAYMVTDSLELEYSNNTVAFEFVACAYADPENVNFEYRLLGQDVDWVESGERGYVRFNKLSFGEYTFQVRTVSADLDDSQNITEIFLKIYPPIWATKGAYFLYALLTLGLVALIRLLERRRQQKKIKEEQQKVAQEKRINNELRKIDKLKDQFLANTSHELRTPLNGIIGLAESLVDGATGKLPSNTVKNLRMISSSGKRLANLVNDILDFSKLKTDSLKLNLQPVDIHSASDVVLALLDPLRKGKEIEFINKIPKNISLIEADENRIQQILYNLLGNAIKFTEKGRVTIDAKEIEGQAYITISDTGIGIPKNKFTQIFNSFQQVDGSDTRGYSGAGLGLAVTKQLVELHNGNISVDSEENVGSSFTFSIPLSKLSRNDATFQSSSSSDDVLIQTLEESDESQSQIEDLSVLNSNRDLTILVVDDEAINREVLKNHLTTAGYSVVQAANGKEALDKTDKLHFDLIILDIMMPGMSGNEVCRIIREKHPANVLPIIMLTAKNSIGDLVKGFTVGANDYLAKPFSKDELLTRIKTHINLQSVFSATGKFVPYEFLNAIGRKEITDVRLGDHAEVDVTVMFSDIREFTRISESMTPTENFKFVNDFVGRMGPIIQKNNGFVNQYLGDGIMAIFPNKPDDAIKAAVEMLEDVKKMNKESGAQKDHALRVGIGLHTGPLIMGIIGDANRTDPATIADTVNISSRLEGLNKHFRTNLIVSADSIDQNKGNHEFNFRYLGEVRLKGKKALIGIHECFDGDHKSLRIHKIQTKPEFENGLTFYYKGDFEKSKKVFTHIYNQNTEDTVAQFFMEKSIELLKTGVTDDWSGVEKMTKK